MKIWPSACCGDIVEKERALPLLGAHLPERQQAREAAIGGAVARQAQEARAVLQIETRPDDELQPDLLGGEVRAHDAGKRVAVGDGERGQAQRLRLRDELLAMRGAAQEREVGRDLQLGVARRVLLPYRSPEQPVQEPARLPLVAPVEPFAEHPVAGARLVLDAVVVARAAPLPCRSRATTRARCAPGLARARRGARRGAR